MQISNKCFSAKCFSACSSKITPIMPLTFIMPPTPIRIGYEDFILVKPKILSRALHGAYYITKSDHYTRLAYEEISEVLREYRLTDSLECAPKYFRLSFMQGTGINDYVNMSDEYKKVFCLTVKYTTKDDLFYEIVTPLEIQMCCTPFPDNPSKRFRYTFHWFIKNLLKYSVPYCINGGDSVIYRFVVQMINIQ